MSHLFMVNAHDEIQQAIRLCQILSHHYESRPLLYLDGRGLTDAEWSTLRPITDGIIIAPNEPSKCKGIINALNGLMAYAIDRKKRVVSFLHADHVPTDRRQWKQFLLRFEASQKTLTFCPMLPGHVAPSFCTLHFWPEMAAKLFPIKFPMGMTQDNPLWYNEMITSLYWDTHYPEWRDEAMPVSLLTVPYTGQCRQNGKVTALKEIHGPRYSYSVNDLCPDSSVVHSNDPGFWKFYPELTDLVNIKKIERRIRI